LIQVGVNQINQTKEDTNYENTDRIPK